MRAIPEEYRGTVPYLNVNDAMGAIAFYRAAFGAREIVQIPRQGGKVAHAELRIGDAVFMVRDEYPEYHFFSPTTIGGVGLASWSLHGPTSSRSTSASASSASIGAMR